MAWRGNTSDIDIREIRSKIYLIIHRWQVKLIIITNILFMLEKMDVLLEFVIF